MFHAPLLHLMLVAAPTQTTFIINLKRGASTFTKGHAGRPNTPSGANFGKGTLLVQALSENEHFYAEH
jgi:hypothetical protein